MTLPRFHRTVASAVVTLASLAWLSGCVVAPQRSTSDYPSANAGYPPVNSGPRPVPAYSEFGRVENIGVVQHTPRSSGAGAVLGAVLGAVVGNQIGSGGGRAVATGAGAIGGAVAGNAIEGRGRRADEVFRVQVRFENGSTRDFDFERIDDLRVGDRVKLENGQLHRI